MKEELRRILIHVEFLYGVSVETTEETINKIERLIDLAVAEERKRIVEEIKIIADTTPPNLLLNEIVSRIQ